MNASLAYQFLGNPSKEGDKEVKQEDEAQVVDSIDRSELERYISNHDLKRLDSYSKNLCDFHLVMDLVPTIAKLHFMEEVLAKGSVNLSYV